MGIGLLIVDDDPDIRMLVRLWLADAPEEIEILGEASSAREAIDLVRDLRPDVVLLDVRMPAVDGFEAAEQIREVRADQQLILYSGAVDERLRRRALAAGFAECISKDDYARLPRAIVEAARRPT